MGIRVVAPTLEELVPPATAGLYAAVGELTPGGSAGEWIEQAYEHVGEDRAGLLRDHLGALLLQFERGGKIVAAHRRVVFGDDRLIVRAAVAPVDVQRSSLEREVKAITYHELAIVRTAEGFEARVIVDI